jgi:hypothetical protein
MDCAGIRLDKCGGSWRISALTFNGRQRVVYRSLNVVTSPWRQDAPLIEPGIRPLVVPLFDAIRMGS